MQSVLVVGTMQLTLAGVFPGGLEILNDLMEFDSVFRSLLVRVDDLVSINGWWLNQDYSSVMSLMGALFLKSEYFWLVK